MLSVNWQKDISSFFKWNFSMVKISFLHRKWVWFLWCIKLSRICPDKKSKLSDNSHFYQNRFFGEFETILISYEVETCFMFVCMWILWQDWVCKSVVCMCASVTMATLPTWTHIHIATLCHSLPHIATTLPWYQILIRTVTLWSLTTRYWWVSQLLEKSNIL